MDDSNQQKTLIVVGGNSPSGRALRARFSGWPTLALVRGRAETGERSIASFSEPPADLDLRDATIVICADTQRGTRDELWRINVDVPTAWARRGIEGGADRFIQISSFSIFGGAEEVGPDSPVSPVSHYGESKLGAERALQELAGGAMRTTMLRVPILVGDGQDKLTTLVRFASRTGLAITAPWPAPRSMLPYDGLARAIEAIIHNAARDSWQALFAADPEPFSARMMIDAAEANRRKLRAMPVPAVLLKLLEKAAPGLHASLFRPSLLDPAVNLLADGKDFVRLRTIISAMLRD